MRVWTTKLKHFIVAITHLEYFLNKFDSKARQATYMLAFFHLFGPLWQLSLHHECGEFAHAELYVDVLLLLLDKSQSDNFLGFLNAHEHSLSWLNRNCGDRVVGHFDTAQLVQSETIESQKVARSCADKNMTVVIWPVS